MASGNITRKDLITDEGLSWGSEYAKNLQIAIDKNDELVKSSKQLFALYQQLQGVANNKQLVAIQNKQIQITQTATKAYEDQGKALAKVDEERQKSLSSLLRTTNKLQNVNTTTNKQNIEARETLRLQNLEIKRNLTFMGRLTNERDKARKSVQELQAKLALGKKLSDQEQRELKESTREFQKYDKAVKGIRKSTNQFQENVGNYPKILQPAIASFKTFIPLIGAGFGLREAWDFSKEAAAAAREAKGVQFAFDRLGSSGIEALEKIKKSTRGLLSELEIKRSLVEFDNFNISLEETDTLMEFLAVRATQTGTSIDKLKDSLVEGLSKESKLRIDNLGISASELNAELEKTPDFVKAVANIAKREVAEAGDILDEASNSQERLNAAFEDFKVSAGGGFIGRLTNEFNDLKASILGTFTNINDASDGFLSFIKNFALSTNVAGNAQVIAQAAINRERKARIPIVEQIISQQKELGFTEDVLTRNRKQLLELSKQQLLNILKSYEERQQQTKATEELTEAEKKRAEQLRKQREEDKFGLDKQRLQSQADAQKRILDSDNETTSKRLAASVNYTNKSIELLQLERDRAIKLAKGRTDEITRINEAYSDDYNALIREREDNVQNILKDSFEKTKARIEAENQLQEDVTNKRINEAQARLRTDLETLNGPARLAHIEAYEDEVTQIERNAAEERLKNQISVIEKELANPMLDPEQRISLEQMLADAKIALSDEQTDNAIANAERQAEAEQRLFDMKQQLLSQSSQSIADSLGLDAQNIESLFTSFLQKAESTGDAVIDKYNQVAQTLSQIGAVGAVVGDVFAAISEANIQSIDEQIDAQEEYFDRQIELAGEDESQREALEEERKIKREKLEEKKRQEQIKAAKFAKAFSIFNIGVTTAQAVIAALAPPPVGLGPLLGGPLAITAGALGALQIAAVLAKPIPKYRYGTEDHVGGLAEVAEVRPEVIMEPGKKPYIQKTRATLNLAPHTKVIPSVEEFSNQMIAASIMTSLAHDKHNLNHYETLLAFEKYSGEMVGELKENTRAIKRLKLGVNIQNQKYDIPYQLFRSQNIKW